MDLALVVTRFVHFAALLILFGAGFFALALAPASLAGDIARLLRRLTLPLALLALASGLAWLVLVTRDMSGGPADLPTIEAVLTGTEFGSVWQPRLVILLLLVLSALRPGRRWIIPTALAGLAVASLGLVGHAAMQEGATGIAHRLNHAIHLLTVSIWLGGLPPFLLCLSLVQNARSRHDAIKAMIHYSNLGHVVVVAVLVTGVINIALTSHAVPWPLDTGYRAGLAAKIFVYCIMVALALFNRYGLVPRIGHNPTAARALAWGTVAQIVLALVAVALVSGFATLNPNPIS